MCAALVQGKVVENGSHSELLARGGKYAELWARQASVDDLTEAPSTMYDAPADDGGAAENGNSGSVGEEILEDAEPQHRQAGGGGWGGKATEPLERRLEGGEAGPGAGRPSSTGAQKR